MRQIRTDLAMEQTGARDLPGVTISSWEAGDIVITEVRIDTGEGAKLLNKAPGVYVTLECAPLRKQGPELRIAMASLLGEELLRLMPPEDDRPVLVIGLGNRSVTPDSLGPKTVERTLVTRHIFRELPDSVDDRMSPVCAVAPGVLGVTGIETLEVARGIVREVNPRVVIVIDALTARASSRVGSTVQLTDTGIQPGSGVGNHRSALTDETLGVKVLALGVPTVIYAATIARDALSMLSEDDGTREEELDHLCEKLFEGALGEMIVTPREIDDLVGDVAQILASGINQALHPGLSEKEILTMMS
ncbi:GPR endopeptidase [Bacillota bacterium Meth-B3]